MNRLALFVLLFASLASTFSSQSWAQQLQVAAPAGPAPTYNTPAEVAKDDEHGFGGVGIATGALMIDGDLVGGFGRIVPIVIGTEDENEAGPFWGVQAFIEGWGATRGRGGFTYGFDALAGLRSPAFHIAAGVGLNLITLDVETRWRGVGPRTALTDEGLSLPQAELALGFGGFSPRASLHLGGVFGGVMLDTFVEVQRRWRLELDDVTMVQFGLTFGGVEPFSKPSR